LRGAGVGGVVVGDIQVVVPIVVVVARHDPGPFPVRSSIPALAVHPEGAVAAVEIRDVGLAVEVLRMTDGPVTGPVLATVRSLRRSKAT
jgi:hypothetical protein